MSKELNIFRQDKFNVVMTGIPSSIGENVDMELFHNFVKGFSLPDIDQEIIISYFKGSQLKIPVTPQNDNLNTFMIEFFASENLTNYFMFYKWLKDYRRSESSGEVARKHMIKAVSIMTLNNQKNTTHKISFMDCILVNLGELDLEFGSSEPVTFTTEFEYHDLQVNYV